MFKHQIRVAYQHIEVLLRELGRVQLTFENQVRRATDLIVTATTRHAVTNLDQKPVRMPAHLHSALAKHLTTPGKKFRL